jgi:hypothetical protein
MRVLQLLFCVLYVAAQSNRQEVTNLPGYGPPPTKHYSGFVEVAPATKSHLFYYVVESQGDPKNDPLIWWFNGGPGASSLVGLFAEVGPLLLNEDDKLVTNPFAWNKQANLIFVEFGEGIGYSYCANSSRTDLPCNQSDGTCSPCLSSDSSVADKNVVFMETLVNGKGSQPALFPEFKGRPLYLAGESYAGVYIPTLAHAMLSYFKDTSIVNLHGLWMTDPCTDNEKQGGYLDIGVDFAFEKGFISTELFHTLDGSCTASRTAVGDRVRDTTKSQCKGAWRQYDLATAGIGDAVQPAEVPGLPMYIDPLSAYGPSGGTNLPGLIGSDAMRKALGAEQSLSKVYHIELDNNGYVGFTNQYKACNPHPFPLVTHPFPQFNTSMLDVYRDIVGFANPTSKTARASAANLHSVIVSSGDVDPVVDNHGTESAISALGLAVTNKGTGQRRPWYYNATAVDMKTLSEMPLQYGRDLYVRNAGVQLGGFVTNYDTGSKLTFDMVTVHASGHMVPQYAPQKAYHVIKNSLIGGKSISPQLPTGWDTSSDEAFYAHEKGGGQFATWVVSAMGSDFVNDETPW